MMTETTTQAAPVPEVSPAPVQAAPVPQGDGTDPAAPYGRTPGGRARSRPLSGRRGRPKTGRRAQRTSTIGARGQGSTGTKSRAVDYRPAVIRLTQLITLPIALKQPVDAAVITHHVAGDDTLEFPGIARAISNTAQEYPQVAAALDRLLAVGPLAELVGAVVPLAVQLLHNHGRIPGAMAEKLGATDPAEIAEQLAEQGAKLAQGA